MIKKLSNLKAIYMQNYNKFEKIENISFIKELTIGFSKKNKKIPSRFHYDLNGSKYFEKITKLKEYYVARTEKKILKQLSQEMKKIFDNNLTFIEFGSGSADKISILINDKVKFYIPLDISYDFLVKSSIKLAECFPNLLIIPTYCDYVKKFILPKKISKNKIGFFLGSSIGNFYDKKEKKFLQNAKKTLGNNSFLFVGVDLIKNKRIIEKAYNDPKGISAKFNLNLINRINKVLKTNLKQKDFKYFSYFNEKINSVECFLISKKDQKLFFCNKEFVIKKNEKIQTEISKKFTFNTFSILAKSAGWKVKKYWFDKNKYYSIFLLQNQ